MNNPKILTLVGGISQNSLNKKLFQAVKVVIGEEATLLEYDLTRLPFYSQDIELDPPDSVTEFKDLIREAEAVLLITPEYNRSVPGILKNAIDWGSRPYGQNLWDKLPAALMGASVGNIGTFGSQHHLRQILAYLNVITMNQPEFYLNASHAFNEEGKLIDEKIHHLILNFWTHFQEWIEMYGLKASTQKAFYKSQGLEDIAGGTH